ncbi:hypothetical protein H6F96_22445 [Microcoleus sp. FACHB-53]|nr:hypothetical protein [Microcoleus sp. FACHB-53]
MACRDTGQAVDNVAVATACKNIGDKIQYAAQSTADTVKGKVNRDIGTTQQALEDAID